MQNASLEGGNSAKCLQKCELEIDNRMKVKPFEKKRRINIGWKRKMAWWAGIGWWLHTLHRDSCSGQPSTSLLVLQLEFSQLHNHAAINFGATGIESCLLMHPKVICSKSSFYSVTIYNHFSKVLVSLQNLYEGRIRNVGPFGIIFTLWSCLGPSLEFRSLS